MALYGNFDNNNAWYILLVYATSISFLIPAAVFHLLQIDFVLLQVSVMPENGMLMFCLLFDLNTRNALPTNFSSSTMLIN